MKFDDQSDTVTLIPVAMVTPTKECIYAPSRSKSKKIISRTDFLRNYSDHARVIKISFESDGKSNPQCMTAYGYGLDVWYIVE